MTPKAAETLARRQRHHMARVVNGSELERLASATNWLRAERKRQPSQADAIDDLAREMADRIVATIHELQGR